MSSKRHFVLRSMAIDFDRGAVVADQAHGWGQLVHAAVGVGRVRTTNASWVLPHGRALWVPPGVRAELHCVTDLTLRTLYFPTEALPRLPPDCVVVALDPLLRELVLRAAQAAPIERQGGGRAMRLLAVLHDELAHAPLQPLALPLPPDGDARVLALRILDDPGTRASLDALCEGLSVGRRTLERRFRATTGTPLGAWRRQARLLCSLLEIGSGGTVQSAARIVGYDSVSAFVFAFRSVFGTTPARWRDQAG